MKVLLVAKAPVAGQVKTRLGAVVGADTAAALAAAALLDTIEACLMTGAEGHLSLAGDLRDAVQGDALKAALTGWTISPQRGDGLAERLVSAHADAGPGVVVQIGMDTPHVTAVALRGVAAGLARHDAVLAPAEDGGWWALGRLDPDVVRHVAQVEMSTADTFTGTRRALEHAGCRVGPAPVMTDVDTVADADRVALLAPHTRFARAWREARPGGAP
ncbi:hypothetical protein ASC64_17315 [Nocardioides sp. Root122]|uniref:TIGR04282 family arsenosugar biosynthesis glycosyltransferase n=1 Tax=Nocardioides TaxID=1839 RepID=UPI0007039A68|nr:MULTISPECIES: DUF2064 domain-containing protein [Nocardioides]KQV63354.1 hypothetical protein ASC64_17315 [Nocardioides sp. Root122]MCK9825546.1 DUF2064 domain-containing protein [Nocardioides cavernae]